jgi:hypothetical protein
MTRRLYPPPSALPPPPPPPPVVVAALTSIILPPRVGGGGSSTVAWEESNPAPRCPELAPHASVLVATLLSSVSGRHWCVDFQLCAPCVAEAHLAARSRGRGREQGRR